MDTTRVASTVRERPRNIHKMLFHRQASSNLRGGPGKTRANHIVQQLLHPAVLPTCKVVAIVDCGNWDGVCVALLVKEMLVSHLFTALEQVPYVLTEEDSLPETESALIIFTNGCFCSASFVRQVLEAKEPGVHFMPIVAEENFHFPTETFHEEMRERAPIVLRSQKQRCTQEDRIRDRHPEHFLGDRHRRGAPRLGKHHCSPGHCHCRKTPVNQTQQATSQFGSRKS